MNIVVLIGNLGKDPELTYTHSGTAKCKFSLATSKVRKDSTGEKQEMTFWHNVVVWGQQAEACGKFLAKGRKVCVVGEIESRSYQDKDGQTKHITEINAQRVEFLSGPRDDGGTYDRQGLAQGDRSSARNGNRVPSPAQRMDELPSSGIHDDNLPFCDLPF